MLIQFHNSINNFHKVEATYLILNIGWERYRFTNGQLQTQRPKETQTDNRSAQRTKAALRPAGKHR